MKSDTPSREADAFNSLVDRVLSVSHEELQRREAEYKKQMADVPRKRGRPPKIKGPASSGPASRS